MSLPELLGDGFAYPWVLWFLLLGFLPFLARLRSSRKKRAHGPLAFSRVGALSELRKGWRAYLAGVPLVLRMLALALVIVALARPQTREREEMRVEGIDIYVVLDMSASMQAVDLSPSEAYAMERRGETPQNRFTIAVDVLKEFIRGRRNDRIGMVVFAKDAFLEFPLTLDYGTIINLLGARELGDIDGAGTAIGNALARAVAGLRHSSARSKVLVLITDGDRRGGDISPTTAATMAQHFGIKVFPILVGRSSRALVPGGFGAFGGTTGWEEVEYPVNPALLQKIATMTEGKFYRSSNSASLRQDFHDILNQFERSELEGSVDVNTTELFAPFALMALFLLLLEAALSFLIIRKYP